MAQMSDVRATYVVKQQLWNSSRLATHAFATREHPKLELYGVWALTSPHLRLLQSGASQGASNGAAETTFEALLAFIGAGYSFKEHARVLPSEYK